MEIELFLEDNTVECLNNCINSRRLIFLGELSPMQESKLVQLKSRVSDLLKGKVPSDPVFLRFLRARDFNVDKVSIMLTNRSLKSLLIKR